METFVKKNLNIILSLFILIGPLLDLLTGVCLHTLHIHLTIGIILRVLFLLFICYSSLFIYKKKQLLFPYILIGTYFILYSLGIILYKDGVGLFTEIQNLVKVFYYPILLISFYSIREEIRISKCTLFSVLFLYLIFIFIPTIFQIGYKTYEITKEGTLGFFNSANEISGIISILTPVMFYIVGVSKRILPKILLFGMYFVVILMVGTKTPLLSFCLTLGFAIAFIGVEWMKKKEYKKVGISLGAIVLGIASLCLIIPHTNFYKNIEVHLDFLGIKSIHEVFEKEEYIDHFIFSQRLTFFKDQALIYRESPMYQKLFGIGYLKEGKDLKQIEMDYFDVYYNHGVVGFLIFFSCMIYILFKVLEKKQKNTWERYMTLISLILIIFLSFFTGHILTSPAVSLICVIIITSLDKRKVKTIWLITSKKKKDWKWFEKEILEDHNKIKVLEAKKYKKIEFLWLKLIYFKTVDLGVYDGKENLDLLEDVSKKTYNVTNTKLERKEILHKTELMI